MARGRDDFADHVVDEKISISEYPLSASVACGKVRQLRSDWHDTDAHFSQVLLCSRGALGYCVIRHAITCPIRRFKNVIPRVSSVGCVHENVFQKNTRVRSIRFARISACSLVAFQPALLRRFVCLFDEPHRVLLVDRQPKPHRIRVTTQLVNLGSGHNDANQFFLCTDLINWVVAGRPI